MREIRAPEEWVKHSNVKKYEVITDIGSGLSEDRGGLKRMLKLLTEKKVSKVMVEYPDRLTRFGLETLGRAPQSIRCKSGCIRQQPSKTSETPPGKKLSDSNFNIT